MKDEMKEHGITLIILFLVTSMLAWVLLGWLTNSIPNFLLRCVILEGYLIASIYICVHIIQRRRQARKRRTRCPNISNPL